jgi:SpoVK/Ycf46/Vps4 family AAA+-type ATPase
MDQITRIKERVSVFATTNMPWELDIAALRRFQRRVLVPMPNHSTRTEILKLHAGTQHCLTDKDFDYLASKTDGYSGSDISTLVNDGLMRPIKQLQQAQFFKRVGRSEVLDKIDQFKSKFMIYADEMAYDETDDSPLAVSIQLNNEEETKHSTAKS